MDAILSLNILGCPKKTQALVRTVLLSIISLDRIKTHSNILLKEVFLKVNEKLIFFDYPLSMMGKTLASELTPTHVAHN